MSFSVPARGLNLYRLLSTLPFPPHVQANHLYSSQTHMSTHAHTHTCRTCGCAAAEWGGRGDGGRDGRRQVTAGVARRRGRAAPGHSARDGQGQLGCGLLLHGLLLPACCIRHEPDGAQEMPLNYVVGWHIPEFSLWFFFSLTQLAEKSHN